MPWNALHPALLIPKTFDFEMKDRKILKIKSKRTWSSTFYKNVKHGAGKITWWINCLLYKHKYPSSDPHYPGKMPKTVIYTCKASTEEGRDRSSPGVCWPASLVEEGIPRISERPISRTNKLERVRGGYTRTKYYKPIRYVLYILIYYVFL